jgi:ribulose-phosphate 3-epimerase
MLDQVQKLDWLDRERASLGLQFLIEVDGGINDKTKRAVGLADVLVAGSYVFKNDPKAAIQSLRSYD